MADWILSVAGLRLACEVLHRKQDKVRLQLAEPVTIKAGRWAMLVAPGDAARLIVEIGLPKSPTVIECSLLGTFAPSPTVCLQCGRILQQHEVVRRVAGMKKAPARELCPACWESEAARQLRPSFECLANGDDDDDGVLIDNQDYDFDD